MGVTLSVLSFMSEYSATRLLLSLSKQSRAFLDKHRHHINRQCLPNYPECGSIKEAKGKGGIERVVFQKGLRQKMHVHQVMFVKDSLFVIAYKDFTFDLINMDDFEKFQTADEKEDVVMKVEESKQSEQ